MGPTPISVHNAADASGYGTLRRPSSQAAPPPGFASSCAAEPVMNLALRAGLETNSKQHTWVSNCGSTQQGISVVWTQSYQHASPCCQSLQQACAFVSCVSLRTCMVMVFVVSGSGAPVAETLLPQMRFCGCAELLQGGEGEELQTRRGYACALAYGAGCNSDLNTNHRPCTKHTADSTSLPLSRYPKNPKP